MRTFLEPTAHKASLLLATLKDANQPLLHVSFANYFLAFLCIINYTQPTHLRLKRSAQSFFPGLSVECYFHRTSQQKKITHVQKSKQARFRPNEEAPASPSFIFPSEDVAPGARVKACLLGHLCWARVVPLFDFDGSRYDEKKTAKRALFGKIPV